MNLLSQVYSFKKLWYNEGGIFLACGIYRYLRDVSFGIAFFMQSITKIKMANIGSSICDHYQDMFGHTHRLRPTISEHLKAARNLDDVFLCPLHKNDGLALNYNEMAELSCHLYEAHKQEFEQFYGPYVHPNYVGLKEIKHNSIYEFFDFIGYNYKSKKFN